MQTAKVNHAFAQHDVRTTASHVGGNGYAASLASQGNNFGFLLVLFGVEHAVGDAELCQPVREHFGRFNGDGAHKHGLLFIVQFGNGLHNGVELLLPRAVDEVGVILADHGPVGRNGNDIEVVNLVEFNCFGVSRTGHARKLVVQAKVVLEGDRGQSLVFGGDGDVFLGFQRLMQAV